MLSFSQARALITTAVDTERNDFLLFRWIAGGYDLRGFPFAEFYAKSTAAAAPEKTADEIFDELEKKMSGLVFVKR